MTHLNLQGKALLRGGIVWDGTPIQMQKNYILLVTVEEATVAVAGFGNIICNSWQTKADWKYMCLIFQQEHLNGIKLSTDCFAIFQKTGRDNH